MDIGSIVFFVVVGLFLLFVVVGSVGAISEFFVEQKRLGNKVLTVNNILAFIGTIACIWFFEYIVYVIRR
ncbi:MAG: hypothetical protein WC749_02320 [Dehalococcoidia bacterium]